MLLPLVVACSGGDDSKTEIERTAVEFYSALSDNPPAAYTHLSSDCRREIDYLDFVAAFTDFRGFLGEGELKIRNVRITDQIHDHIAADYDVVLKTNGEEISLRDQLAVEGPARFVKEDGRWRFEDCAGFPTADGNSSSEATPTFEPGSPAAIEADEDPTLPGKFIDLQAIYGGNWGNRDGVNTAAHVRAAIDYSVQGELPPAGGPHWGAAGGCAPDPNLAALFCGPVPWGVYDEAFPAESVVHNMEHAGVVIWHNTSDDSVLAQLQALANLYLDEGWYIVMMPYSAMESDTIALTAWARRDNFSTQDYSDNRVRDFIEALECRFDPEDLCGSDPDLLPDSTA
jgi:hypothetical protein